MTEFTYVSDDRRILYVEAHFTGPLVTKLDIKNTDGEKVTLSRKERNNVVRLAKAYRKEIA